MKHSNEKMEDYKRVTEILSLFTDFSQIDPAVLANAADRGSRTHKFCELYLKNLLIEEVDEDCKPYFESFVKWEQIALGQIFELEERYFCEKIKVTGQIDMVLTLKGEDKPIIVDIKTPQNEQKTWPLQTAAYMYLYNQKNESPVQRRACLMLDKNGGAAKFKEYTNHESEIELFLSAVKLHNFLNGSKI